MTLALPPKKFVNFLPNDGVVGYHPPRDTRKKKKQKYDFLFSSKYFFLMSRHTDPSFYATKIDNAMFSLLHWKTTKIPSWAEAGFICRTASWVSWYWRRAYSLKLSARPLSASVHKRKEKNCTICKSTWLVDPCKILPDGIDDERANE